MADALFAQVDAVLTLVMQWVALGLYPDRTQEISDEHDDPMNLEVHLRVHLRVLWLEVSAIRAAAAAAASSSRSSVFFRELLIPFQFSLDDRLMIS